MVRSLSMESDRWGGMLGAKTVGQSSCILLKAGWLFFLAMKVWLWVHCAPLVPLSATDYSRVIFALRRNFRTCQFCWECQLPSCSEISAQKCSFFASVQSLNDKNIQVVAICWPFVGPPAWLRSRGALAVWPPDWYQKCSIGIFPAGIWDTTPCCANSRLSIWCFQKEKSKCAVFCPTPMIFFMLSSCLDSKGHLRWGGLSVIS